MSGTSPEDPGPGAPTIRPGESADLAALVRLSGGNLSYTMRMTTDRVVEAESHLEAQLELRAS